MNKKINESGFTLIELLAIIVILGIIAVIAVPTVKKLTDEAKLKAFENTARGIIKAGNLYYSRKDMMDELNGDMTFTFPDNAEELELQGKLPENGTMVINEDGDIALAISNKKYCITKRFDTDDIEIKEDYDSCKIIMPGSLNALVTTSTDVTEVPKCLIEDTKCEAGTPVAVKVNEKDVYNFYIIKDTGTEVTLIMDRNLGDNVEWINSNDYITENNKDEKPNGCGYTSCNDEGPITVITELNKRTSDWTNIPEKTYTISGLADDNTTRKYEDITITGRSRLITYAESTVEEIGCTTSQGSCPKWMSINLFATGSNVDGNGNNKYNYWTSTAALTNNRTAWVISYNGYVADSNGTSSITSGIRPVITLTK